jgi:hypothetical protein
MSWTRADLKTKVGAWLGRSNLSSQIDDGIALFESDYNTRKGVYRSQNTEDLTAGIGNDYVDLPTDFEGIVALERPGYPGRIKVVPVARLNQARVGASGEPSLAAVYPGGKLKFDVTCDAEYEYELIYHQRLTGLSDSVSSNWLLEKYPHVYLFGVLSYLLEYVQDIDRATHIAARHEANMAALEAGDWEKLLPVQDATVSPEMSAP